MGTRAIIKVEGVPYAGVYKHYDGYRDATLPWLEKFNREFTDNRGAEPDYKFAQLLRSSARDAEEFGLDPSVFTGWGLVKLTRGKADDHWQEYEYTLKKDGTVTVKEI